MRVVCNLRVVCLGENFSRPEKRLTAIAGSCGARLKCKSKFYSEISLKYDYRKCDKRMARLLTEFAGSRSCSGQGMCVGRAVTKKKERCSFMIF